MQDSSDAGDRYRSNTVSHRLAGFTFQPRREPQAPEDGIPSVCSMITLHSRPTHDLLTILPLRIGLSNSDRMEKHFEPRREVVQYFTAKDRRAQSHHGDHSESHDVTR